MADPRKGQPWPGTAGTNATNARTAAPKAAAETAKEKPPSRVDQVRALCKRRMRATIATLLAKGVDVERFAAVFLSAVEGDANLVRCTDGSLARAMMHSAEVGLEVGGAYPHAYLIPYYNKDGERYEAQFQISVWGYLELVRRSGAVKKVWADVVFANDQCELISGTDGKQIKHKPQWFLPRAKRGEVVGAYACAILKGEEGEEDTVVCEPVSREELDQARAANRGNSPAWKDWYEQQCQKVALKRLSKYLPKGTTPARALAIDEDPNTPPPVIDAQGIEIDLPQDLQAATPGNASSPTGQLDQVVSQAAKQAAPARMPIERGKLFELLTITDERWLGLRPRVEAWDDTQALAAMSFLLAIQHDISNDGPGAQMPAHLRLDD
jgi:phage RecT family recombinase